LSVVGILPAAGAGERLGADVPKAFAVLGGRPLFEWSLDVLRETCDRVVVAVPPDRVKPPDMVAGGATRSESVRKALEAAPEASIAVVHDAARPLVTAELVRRCIEALEGFDGAIAAAPVTDTIKEVEGASVVSTPDRDRLWAVQTPQVFRADVLRRALEGDVTGATDDASLVEAIGGRVRVVTAPRENLKITTPLDVRVAEMLLAD
jgi:2-C-methyl-D-erythritol 4-phosphate cytidylyltransferase